MNLLSILRKIRYAYYDRRANRFTRDHPRYAKYQIGEYTYGFPEVFDWNEGTTLKIGKFCSIAKGVKIYLGGNHRIDWITTYPFGAFFEEAKNIQGHPTSKGDVIIENDVWIGGDAIILSGVKLSNGSVVGAGAVVTKSVPPYAVVVGNPGKIIKFRFEPKIIEELERICWWDWELEKIKLLLPYLLSNDISTFLRRK